MYVEAERADVARFEQDSVGVYRPVVPPEGEACVRKGPGHDGVRHFGGRSGGHRNHCDIGVSPQAAGALGRYRERHQQLVRDDSGQGTVEYAAVLFGLMVLIAGLAALFRVVESGVLTQHVLQSASHHVGGSIAGVVDAFMY